jgi:hypothetical protein
LIAIDSAKQLGLAIDVSIFWFSRKLKIALMLQLL